MHQHTSAVTPAKPACHAPAKNILTPTPADSDGDTDIFDSYPTPISEDSVWDEEEWTKWEANKANGKIEHCGRVTEIKTIIGSGWHDGIYYDDCMCCRSCM